MQPVQRNICHGTGPGLDACEHTSKWSKQLAEVLHLKPDIVIACKLPDLQYQSKHTNQVS